MATEAQLAEALRRADAAGDTENARHIAEVIRSQRAKSSGVKPTSFWQGFKEEIAAGANNAEAALQATNPLMRIPRLVQRAVTGQDNTTRGKRLDTIDRSIAAAPVQGSTAGRIAGGVVASLPTIVIPGAGGTGIGGRLLSQGATSGAAGGALLSRGRGAKDVARDVAIGAAAGRAGESAGKYIVAPVAERIGRSRPVRRAAEAVVGMANKAIPRKVSLPPLPRYSPAERLVDAQGGVADIRAMAADAQRLGLPLALADTDPKLRALAGSASRFSPNVRATAERELGARSMGQADRAVGAIDEFLSPVTNIEQRAAAIRQGARDAAQPHYDAAFSQPAPVDPQLDAILQTPAGQEAMRRAQQIAANEGKAPGQTFETLDMTKRGLDSVLNDSRNPLTGRLDMEGDPVAASVNDVLQRYKARLDELNPDYRHARAAYAENIAPRTALRTGYGELPKTNIPRRQFDAAIAGMDPAQLTEAQRGYATAMADQVAKQRLAGNPYKSIYGSPLQQGKVASMFPDGAQDFGRVYQLEDEMAKTAQEVLGGSATQPRAMADAQFGDAGADSAADMAIQFATGGGIPGVASAARRALGSRVKDRMALGAFGPQAKADAIGPALLQQNPDAIMALLDDLMRKNAEMEARKAAYARMGGLLAAPAAAGSVVISR